MSNKEHTVKDQLNTAASKPENGKNKPVIQKEERNLRPDQAKKQGNSEDTETDELVTGQSDSDVNGNDLDKNLRNSPAH